jgi:hypothetical protein
MADVEPVKAYEESCATFRHYSNISFAIRASSIVQGFALMYPWTDGLKSGSSYRSLFPAAGIIFTILLSLFHKAYFDSIEFFSTAIAGLESELLPSECRVFTRFGADHEKRMSGLTRFTSIYAPFTLLIFLYSAALVGDLASWLFHFFRSSF